MDIRHVKRKFFVIVEGKEALLNYRLDGNSMDIYHVSTPAELRGRGIAKELALAAFEFARKNKFVVIPNCPYIRNEFLRGHKEFLDIVKI